MLAEETDTQTRRQSEGGETILANKKADTSVTNRHNSDIKCFFFSLRVAAMSRLVH